VSRFQFVADHRHAFEVKRLCELVQVRRSSYYAWLAGAPARAVRAAADAALAERIRTIHDADNTLGAPRVTPELNDGATPEGRVNHKRVARVMREHGIRGYTRRRRVRTTIPEQSDATVPDLIKREFTALAPNRRYVGDITYLPIADGSNLYLATVIDCFSRRLAGWAIVEHMRTDLVTAALTTARDTRATAMPAQQKPRRPSPTARLTAGVLSFQTHVAASSRRSTGQAFSASDGIVRPTREAPSEEPTLPSARTPHRDARRSACGESASGPSCRHGQRPPGRPADPHRGRTGARTVARALGPHLEPASRPLRCRPAPWVRPAR
jgi:hypothetical protein